VSDYRLDDWVPGVRSPAEAKDFSSNPCVQTSSETHPVLCTMGTGGPSPGVKRGRCVTLTTHYIVLRLRMSRSYTYSSPCRLHGGSGRALLLLLCILITLMMKAISFSETSVNIYQIARASGLALTSLRIATLITLHQILLGM
jgi:hypothetical protein